MTNSSDLVFIYWDDVPVTKSIQEKLIQSLNDQDRNQFGQCDRNVQGHH
jgi:hypothetical protein